MKKLSHQTSLPSFPCQSDSHTFSNNEAATSPASTAQTIFLFPNRRLLAKFLLISISGEAAFQRGKIQSTAQSALYTKEGLLCSLEVKDRQKTGLVDLHKHLSLPCSQL